MSTALIDHHRLPHGFCAHGELRGDCDVFALRQASTALVNLSQWIDNSPANRDRDREAALWGRVAKVGEEFGESIEALIGMTGQNPRKVATHNPEDLRKELFDIAVTALGAIEHIDGHQRRSIPGLLDFIAGVWARAEATIEKDNT